MLQVLFLGLLFKFSFGFTFHSGCSIPRFVFSLKFIGPRYPYLHSVYYFWMCKSSGYTKYKKNHYEIIRSRTVLKTKIKKEILGNLRKSP